MGIELTPAVIGLLGVVIGAVISQIGALWLLERRQKHETERLQIQERSEHERRRAEVILGYKIESLQEVYLSLIECKQAIQQEIGGRKFLFGELSDEQTELWQEMASEGQSLTRDMNRLADEVVPLIWDYQDSITQAGIHLDLDQRWRLLDLSSQFFRAMSYIIIKSIRNEFPKVSEKEIIEKFEEFGMDSIFEYTGDVDNIERLFVEEFDVNEFLQAVIEAEEVLREEIQAPVRQFERQERLGTK